MKLFQFNRLLMELKQEMKKIDMAIRIVEELQATAERRSVGADQAVADTLPRPPRKPGRIFISPAEREASSLRMKKYWAKLRETGSIRPISNRNRRFIPSLVKQRKTRRTVE